VLRRLPGRSARAARRAYASALGHPGAGSIHIITSSERSHDRAMTLVEAYPLLKPLHITLVVASGLLFTARGAAVLAGQGWPMRPLWRHASVAIDTLLLSAGVTMWVVLSLHPLRRCSMPRPWPCSCGWCRSRGPTTRSAR
jgi:hypothetical protein